MASSGEDKYPSVCKTVLSLNQLGMENLGDLDKARELLCRAKKALRIHCVSPADRLWGVTLNNLGCCYKRAGEYVNALKCFRKGLEQCDLQHGGEIASLHLNSCTIFSRLGNHCEALTHAHKALEALVKANKEVECARSTALAYFNISIEDHHMGRTGEAKHMMQTGWAFAKRWLSQHAITSKLEQAYFRLCGEPRMPFGENATPRKQSPHRSSDFLPRGQRLSMNLLRHVSPGLRQAQRRVVQQPALRLPRSLSKKYRERSFYSIELVSERNKNLF